MSKVGGRRNFGYGKMLQFAMRSALDEEYGPGRYGTKAAHRERLGPFVHFLLHRGIHDFRKVGLNDVLSYAEPLRQAVEKGNLSIHTAVNRLSSVNVLMEALHGRKKIWISPRSVLGARTQVRREPPRGMDRAQVEAMARATEGGGHERLACLIRLCCWFALRFREASLLNLERAYAEALRSGTIDVRDGTKGGRGRRIERRVPVDEEGLALLAAARRLGAPGSSRLIPEAWSYRRWYKYAHRVYPRYADAAGLSTEFRDLRAAYACTRYKELTGSVAPVIAGRRLASRRDDAAAREVIARELGHGRPSVTNAYCGGKR